MKLVLIVVGLMSTSAHAGPARCKDELVTGVVRRVTKDAITVAIGADEAPLPVREQVPAEKLEVGATLVAYCKDGVLSRTNVRLVELLFTREVPEIVHAIVKIEGVARQPGVRTKIAVSSKDPDVDPIGAVVGIKGSRVRVVVQALAGEKIDMIPYDADASRYVTNAMAPAQIKRMIVDNDARRMELVIPDAEIASAIGERGVNLRLAAQLTGWKLDAYTVTKYAAVEAAAKQQVAAVVKAAGLPKALVEKLYAAGWRSPAEVAHAKPEELVAELGIDAKQAAKLITAAKKR